MYRDIAILLCRVLGLYVLIGVLSSVPMLSGMMFAPVEQGAGDVMAAVKATTYTVLILQLLLAITLWVNAEFWASLITKPVKDQERPASGNVADICAAILMAVGFVVFAAAFPSLKWWASELLSDSGRPFGRWVEMGASVAQFSIGLLLILTPRGIWNGISKLRKA